MSENPTDDDLTEPLSDLSDADLLQLASRSGPRAERAFRELYDRHNQSLKSFVARKYGFKKDVREDIVADAWRRVHLHGHKHDSSRSKVKSWLYVIAGNLCKNVLRNRDRNRESLLSDVEKTWGAEGRRFTEVTADPDAPSPEEQTELRELEEAVEEAITTLPVQQRLPVLLRMEGYAYKEIAEASGANSVGTTKSRLARARDRMRTELKEKGVDLSRWLDMS